MKNQNRGWVLRALDDLKTLWKGVWAAAGDCAPCCGIHLDRKVRDDRDQRVVGTAGTCCGVRM